MHAYSDGFALNVGPEDWQRRSVSLCYDAALELGLPFKLFLSFDMTYVECLVMPRSISAP